MRITSVDTKKNIGQVIRESRIGKGVTQKELCKDVGITQTFLSLLEHGKRNPSYDVLIKIADALGEDSLVLEKNASDVEKNPEIKLNYLLRKLLKNRNRKKIRRVIEFIETLS